MTHCQLHRLEVGNDHQIKKNSLKLCFFVFYPLPNEQASDSDATSSSHMITETAEYSPMQSTPSVTPNSSPPGMPEVITPEPTEETMPPPPPEKPPSLPE